MELRIVIEEKMERLLRICVNNFISMSIESVSKHPFMEGYIEVIIKSIDEDDVFVGDLFNAGVMFGELK